MDEQNKSQNVADAGFGPHLKDSNENKPKQDNSAKKDGEGGGAPEGKDKQGDEKGSDDKKGEEKKPMPPEKKRRLIIIAIIVAVIVIVAGTLYYLHARHYETTDDAFVDGHVSMIAPQVGGRIQSLLVTDNELVEEGQVIIEIDPRDYDVQLAQAEAKQAQANAEVVLQQANLGQSEANVTVADADAFQADQDLKRFQSVNPKAITQQQLDNATAAARSADAKLDASHNAVDAAKAQVLTAEANVQQTNVDVANAKLQLSYTKITAPIKGRITRRTVEVGNVVAPGQALLAVVSNDLWVTANFKETQLDHMRIGQPVDIKVDAFPDVTFRAHVDSFQKGSGSVFSTLPAENATGNYVKVVQRVPVKIVFDDQDQRDKYPLAPGLSVDPRVTVR